MTSLFHHKVQLSREELEQLEVSLSTSAGGLGGHEKGARPCCTLRYGLHVLLLSLLSLPFVFVISALYAFYLGTITWYR